MSTQKNVRGEQREQRQKMRDMSFGGKISYLWYYYKVHAIVGVFVVIFIGVFIYQMATRKSYAFYAALLNTDSGYLADQNWGEEFGEYIGVDMDQYDCYVGSYTSYNASSAISYTYSSSEQFAAMLMMGDVDAVIADTETFESYAQNGFFSAFSYIYTEEELAPYTDWLYYTDRATATTSESDPVDAGISDGTVNHQDPSSMEDPVAVGFILSDTSKIMENGCYNYLAEDGVMCQGYPSQVVLGVVDTSERAADLVLSFLEYINE